LNDLLGLVEQVRFDANISDGSQNVLLLPAGEGNLAFCKIESARCANCLLDKEISTTCPIACRQNYAAGVSHFLGNWKVITATEDDKGCLLLSTGVQRSAGCTIKLLLRREIESEALDSTKPSSSSHRESS
jgi:hypothetical protein